MSAKPQVPDTIYLQVHDVEWTWCEDKIEDSDITFVRRPTIDIEAAAEALHKEIQSKNVLSASIHPTPWSELADWAKDDMRYLIRSILPHIDSTPEMRSGG